MTEGNGRGITTLLTFIKTNLLQSEQWEEPGVVVLKSLKYKSVQKLLESVYFMFIKYRSNNCLGSKTLIPRQAALVPPGGEFT